MLTEFAPAKINLTLHVTGQREDGYHLLDSLVVFADVGDRLSVTNAAELSLAVSGPHGAGLADADNLVLRAANMFGGGSGAAIALEKVLPISSGIGGGSADAAAALRLLARHWQKSLPPSDQIVNLGADVPVCMHRHPVRMKGVGDVLLPLRHHLPPVWLVLVNAGVAVSTPTIFRTLPDKSNAPMPPRLEPFPNAMALATFLLDMRNDLESAATALAPVIAETKAALSAMSGCLIARMSGSGATCFGLFADERHARAAATTLSAAMPGWWVVAAPVLD